MIERIQSMLSLVELAEKRAKSIVADDRLPKILAIQTDEAWQVFIREALDQKQYDEMFSTARRWLALAERTTEHYGYCLEQVERIVSQFDANRDYLSQMVASWDRALTLKSLSQKRMAGKKSKRREWAVLLASKVRDWDGIPDSHSPLEVEGVDRDLRFYRDGDTVCCVDAVTGEAVGTLKRTTLERRYLRGSHTPGQ